MRSEEFWRQRVEDLEEEVAEELDSEGFRDDRLDELLRKLTIARRMLSRVER